MRVTKNSAPQVLDYHNDGIDIRFGDVEIELTTDELENLLDDIAWAARDHYRAHAEEEYRQYAEESLGYGYFEDEDSQPVSEPVDLVKHYHTQEEADLLAIVTSVFGPEVKVQFV